MVVAAHRGDADLVRHLARRAVRPGRGQSRAASLTAARDRGRVPGPLGPRPAAVRAVPDVRRQPGPRRARHVAQHPSPDQPGREAVPARDARAVDRRDPVRPGPGAAAGHLCRPIYRDGPIDHVARVVSLVGVSIPIFWLAAVSLVIFYAALQIAVGPGRLGPQIQPPPHVTGLLTPSTACWPATWRRFAARSST